MKFTRRNALKVGLSSLAYYSTQATTPNWVIRSAEALSSCLPPGRILVILQQAGGNDGLNTVIPRTDPVYYDAATRPTIQVPAGTEINLDTLNGFHPRLANLANWYQQGKVAIIQNVGYSNPNLSHFTSTDYWEFGSVPGQTLPTQGWAARFYDSACAGYDPDPIEIVAAGITAVPDALEGITGYTPPAISDPAEYALSANQDAALRLPAISALNSVATLDPEIDFLQRSVNVATASAADVATAAALADLVPPGSYSNDSLGEGLHLVSQIIRAGFATKIFYVSQGGYDTHSGQIAAGDPLNQGDHPQLLDAFDRSVSAFLTEMQLTDNLDRVIVLTFSEFGRRVKENGSFGTDHGAANCLMAFGGQIAGGVYGGQPDLVDLTKGNLKHRVDFRSVYSRVIETWFGASAAPVFGQPTYDSIIAPDLPNIPFIQSHSAVAPRRWGQYR